MCPVLTPICVLSRCPLPHNGLSVSVFHNQLSPGQLDSPRQWVGLGCGHFSSSFAHLLCLSPLADLGKRAFPWQLLPRTHIGRVRHLTFPLEERWLKSSSWKVKYLGPDSPLTDLWALESLLTSALNQYCLTPDWSLRQGERKSILSLSFLKWWGSALCDFFLHYFWFLKILTIKVFCFSFLGVGWGRGSHLISHPKQSASGAPLFWFCSEYRVFPL